MMISVKKGFISSNSRIICLPCPLSCGHFFIQESAVGGLSYYIKKNVPWHILAPSAVACDMFLLRASAHPRGAFFIS